MDYSEVASFTLTVKKERRDGSCNYRELDRLASSTQTRQWSHEVRPTHASQQDGKAVRLKVWLTSKQHVLA